MAIQVYDCPVHRHFEVLLTGQAPTTWRCPTDVEANGVGGVFCDERSEYVISAPALVHIQRDWNEKANEYRRDPYTQAKAQLTNQHRSAIDRVERYCDRPPDPVTEEAIQVGAKEIHKAATVPRPGPQERQVAAIRKARRKEIKERKEGK